MDWNNWAQFELTLQKFVEIFSSKLLTILKTFADSLLEKDFSLSFLYVKVIKCHEQMLQARLERMYHSIYVYCSGNFLPSMGLRTTNLDFHSRSFTIILSLKSLTYHLSIHSYVWVFRYLQWWQFDFWNVITFETEFL